MNGKFGVLDDPLVATALEGRHEKISILAVGAPEEWKRQGKALPSHGKLAFVAFHEVTGYLLDKLNPAAVVSPVLAKGFDCIDLAQVLHSLDFKGPYRAAAPDLPKPKLIESEIAQLCPRLDFQIVTTL